MKNIVQILVLIVILYLVFKNKSVERMLPNTNTVVENNSYKELKKVVFQVRGLGDVNYNKLKEVANTIENFYGFRTIITDEVDISEDMYIKNTKEILNATICLKDLNDFNVKTIYVTNKELWASGDFVNGLAYFEGNCVVITTTAKVLEETVKHEVGHIFGLGHCTEKTCVMASANDQYETGKFCEKCKNHFIKKFNINE